MRTKALKIIKNLSLIDHNQLPPRDDDNGGRLQQYPARDYIDPAKGVLPQQSELLPVYELNNREQANMARPPAYPAAGDQGLQRRLPAGQQPQLT